MEVVAVLSEVFGVSGVEGETVSTRLQFSDSVVALPVFVAGDVVGVEAEVVWAFERLLGHSWRRKNKIRLGNLATNQLLKARRK